MLVVNKREVRIIKFLRGYHINFDFQEVQRLEHVSVSDAHMFRIGNKLYMLVANDKGSNIAVVRYNIFFFGFKGKIQLNTQFPAYMNGLVIISL